MKTPSTTIYTPASPLRDPGALVASVLAGLWNSRELVWILFLRDLRAQFRQSFLGYAWLVIPPLANAAVWHLLQSQQLINARTEIPYPVFVLVGSTLWAAFVATVMVPSDVIAQNKDVFTKLDVPLEAFVLAGAARAIFNLLVTSLVLIPVLATPAVSLASTAWLFPVAGIALVALAFSIGLLIAPLGALYSDVRAALTPILGLAMFAAPVVFPIPEGPGLLAAIVRASPITPAIALGRDALLTGRLDWLGPMLFWGAASAALMLAAFVALRVAKPHVIARMGM